jgi:hypothetical protein
MNHHRSKSRLATTSVLLVAALGLGACADTRKAIGWDKATPDEFRVVTRAPLTLPPDFGLRPPAPGAARPQEQSPQDAARTAIFGPERGTATSASTANSALSASEQALLNRTGGDRAEASIRETIEREAQSLAEADQTFVDRLVFWQTTPSASSATVDPAREAQRLREAQATGRSANDGDVATIRARKRGWLEGIF